MALHHFHLAHISRGSGQSAVAAAAYRAGECLHDNYYGLVHDYTKKGGVILSEIMLPPDAPERFIDRETLWNEVEQIEKNGKAQLAFSFDIALQNELTIEENIEMARRFIMENFVSRGMICDVAFHNPGKDPGDIQNPHFHVLVPMRPLNKNGTWGTKQHREYVLDNDGNRVKGPDGKWLFNAVKNTDWSDPETLVKWRANWAETVNETFAEKGIAARIDHRSYEERGIDDLPQVHEGPKVRAMEKRGIRTDKGDWNRLVKSLNTGIKKLLLVFKNILSDIDEMKKERAAEREKNATALLEAKEKRNDFWDAIEEYRADIDEKYKYARHTWKSKKALELMTFIYNNQITEVEGFEKIVTEMYSRLSELQADVKKRQERRSEINTLLRRQEEYKKYLPVYKAWFDISNPAKKDKYAKEHERELTLFRIAERELKEHFPDKKFPKKELLAEKTAIEKELPALQYRYENAKQDASLAYRFKRQVYDAHKERKKTNQHERS